METTNSSPHFSCSPIHYASYNSVAPQTSPISTIITSPAHNPPSNSNSPQHVSNNSVETIISTAGSSSTTSSSTSAFLIGQLGGNFLLEALSTASQPFKVIEEFQDNNLLKCSGVHSLPLLSLHGLSRREIHLSLCSALRDQLVAKIQTLDKEKLENLLEQTFPYISFEQLRAIPMAILKKLEAVPLKFLKQLALNPELYKECPIEVKRQIWLTNESLFQEEVFKQLNEYLNDSNVASIVYEMTLNPSQVPVPPTKRRKLNKQLTTLIHMIGKSIKLYHITVHLLRNIFANMKNMLICTLRADILMALHDSGVSEIVDSDPCHKFAWCLDACGRDNNVELRRIQEMKSFFESIPNGNVVIGDVAMIIANPFTSNTLLRNVYDTLVGVVKKMAIPKEDETLTYISSLLSLGLRAQSILSSQKFQIPHADRVVMHEFYPLLSSILVDDFSREGKESAERQLDPQFRSLFLSNELARTVILYYVLTRVRARDYMFVSQVLKIVDELTAAKIVEEQSFIQSLATAVIAVKHAPTRVVVLDNFLMNYRFSSIFIHKQIVRTLTELHARISIKDFISHLQRLVPSSDMPLDAEKKKKLMTSYKRLLDRMGDRLNDSNAKFLLDFMGTYYVGRHEKYGTSTFPSPRYEDMELDKYGTALSPKGVPSSDSPESAFHSNYEEGSPPNSHYNSTSPTSQHNGFGSRTSPNYESESFASAQGKMSPTFESPPYGMPRDFMVEEQPQTQGIGIQSNNTDPMQQ